MKLRLILSVVLVSLSTFSCDSSEDKLTIGMMPKLIGIPFFNACEKGAVEAARELDVELIFDGPDTDNVTKQMEMLDTWIAKGFDIIAVAPNDPNAVAPTLKRAMAQGIRVLSWDADSHESSREYFVNQASYEGIGTALVDVMAEQTGGKGEVAIITGSLTAANQNIWMEWMRKRVAEKYPDLKLLPPRPALEDQQQAFQVAQDVLKAHPNLVGLYGITSVALPAAAEAVRQAGKADRIVVCGLSTPNLMRQYIKDGTVKEFVGTSPVNFGYLTVHTAKLLKVSGKLPKQFKAGRLGDVSVEGSMVIMGEPIRFNKGNIDDYDF